MALTPLHIHLDTEFECWFTDEEFLEDWECEEDALEYFDVEFEDRYYGSLEEEEIIRILEDADEFIETFHQAMEICKYVAEKEPETIKPANLGGDKMLQLYIYIYHRENNREKFIEKIKKYFEPIPMAEVAPIPESDFGEELDSLLGTEELPVAEPLAEAVPIVEAEPDNRPRQ